MVKAPATGRILIRDCHVVLPEEVAETNLLIEAGKIQAVDAARDSAADKIIEAAGLTVMPGVIDDQVHFREPGATHKEDIESGSICCAAGGVTTFLEMPNTNPPATSEAPLRAKYARGDAVSRVNYGFYIGATPHNVEDLKKNNYAPGIKIFIGSSTGDLLVDEQDALERIFAETNLPICAHCEDESTVRSNMERLGDSLSIEDHSRVRDHKAAIIATRRAIDLATRHKHRFHVLHVSTAAEVPEIVAAHPSEVITSEVCLHHLFFNVEDYARLGSLIQMNPSVKNPEDNAKLWEALVGGDIQVIATDHAPHLLSEKAADYPASPSGLPAVENSLALMLNQHAKGLCSLSQIAGWMSDAPARIWGLVGKGRIATGYDADLVLVDTKLTKEVRNEEQKTRCGYSPWAGERLTGWPVRTIVGGHTVMLDGNVFDKPLGNAVVCDHSRGGYFRTVDGIGVE